MFIDCEDMFGVFFLIVGFLLLFSHLPGGITLLKWIGSGEILASADEYGMLMCWKENISFGKTVQYFERTLCDNDDLNLFIKSF